MKKESVVLGTMILSIASIATRLIGFAFRVYINRKLGTEGVGVYQLIVSLYTVAVTFASSGVSTAVSKLTAEQFAKKNIANAKQVLHRAIGLSLMFSLSAAAILLLGSQPISQYLLHEERTRLALLFLAPSLPFLAVTACFRGYLIAKRSMIRPAIDQILEQTLKIALVIPLVQYMLPMGLEYGCAALLIGMSIGEVFSFLFLWWSYRKESEQGYLKSKPSLTGVTGAILSICLPISFSSYIRSGLRLLEDILIVSGLKAFSGDSSLATQTYGMLRGMAMPLLTFPLSMLSAFVLALTPEISRLSVSANSGQINKTISKILQVTTIIGIFIVSLYMTFSYELGLLFYKDPAVGELLRVMSFLCPFMCIEMVVVSILQGMGDRYSSMRYNILDSIMRVGLVYVLTPLYGQQGFLWMVVASNLLTSLLNLNKLLRMVNLRFRLGEWVIKPALAALACHQIFQAIGVSWLYQKLPLWLVLPVLILLAVVVYCALLLSLGSITKADWQWVCQRFRRTRGTRAQTISSEAI